MKKITNKDCFFKFLTENKINDRIIKAFKAVDPQIFIDSIFESRYYTKERIFVGEGETTDNIYHLAKMLNYLNPQANEKIYEIGTGSGFSTAVLSLLVREVYTIDRHDRLVTTAKKKLYSNGYENIRFFCGEGTDVSGEDFKGIDGAVIFSACKKRPMTVISIVKDSGNIVYPMGPIHQHQIIHIKKEFNIHTKESYTTFFHEIDEFPLISGLYGFEHYVPMEILPGKGDPDDDYEDDDE